MKKTLVALSVIGAFALSNQASQAFSWQNLNPANWGTCPRCERPKRDCLCKKDKCNPCKKMENPCNPCETKQVPCDPCMKKESPCDKVKTYNTPCDPCDKLQNSMDK